MVQHQLFSFMKQNVLISPAFLSEDSGQFVRLLWRKITGKQLLFLPRADKGQQVYKESRTTASQQNNRLGFFCYFDIRWLIQSNTDLEISENAKVLVLMSVTSIFLEGSIHGIGISVVCPYFFDSFCSSQNKYSFFPHAFMVGTGKKLKIQK